MRRVHPGILGYMWETTVNWGVNLISTGRIWWDCYPLMITHCCQLAAVGSDWIEGVMLNKHLFRVCFVPWVSLYASDRKRWEWKSVCIYCGHRNTLVTHVVLQLIYCTSMSSVIKSLLVGFACSTFIQCCKIPCIPSMGVCVAWSPGFVRAK